MAAYVERFGGRPPSRPSPAHPRQRSRAAPGHAVHRRDPARARPPPPADALRLDHGRRQSRPDRPLGATGRASSPPCPLQSSTGPTYSFTGAGRQGGAPLSQRANCAVAGFGAGAHGAAGLGVSPGRPRSGVGECPQAGEAGSAGREISKETSTIDSDQPAQASEGLRALIEASLEQDQAHDIVAIDLAGKTSMADVMIIASGRSPRHIGAITAHLRERLKREGPGPVRIEGIPQCNWVLIDAGDIIVHLFPTRGSRLLQSREDVVHRRAAGRARGGGLARARAAPVRRPYAHPGGGGGGASRRARKKDLYQRYTGRLPWPVTTREITEHRGGSMAERIRRDSTRLLAALPADATAVALDMRGSHLTSRQFRRQARGVARRRPRRPRLPARRRRRAGGHRAPARRPHTIARNP